MTRVDQNVRTLVQRLKALGYRFQFEPHTPPNAKTWKAIQKFEKLAGPLPLSLRAFYDVVGAVDFMGSHPALAPIESSVAPDPLVIYGVDDALAELDTQDPDEDEPYINHRP